MAIIVQLHEPRPPIEYTVKVTHHHGGLVEVEVFDVGSSDDDRRKIADALLEAAALVERGGPVKE